MADKKDNAKDAEERRREAQIRLASAELMYLGCLLFRMALEMFCCLHQGDQFEHGAHCRAAQTHPKQHLMLALAYQEWATTNQKPGFKDIDQQEVWINLTGEQTRPKQPLMLALAYQLKKGSTNQRRTTNDEGLTIQKPGFKDTDK